MLDTDLKEAHFLLRIFRFICVRALSAIGMICLSSVGMICSWKWVLGVDTTVPKT